MSKAPGKVSQSSKKIVDDIKVIEGFMFQHMIWQTKTVINLAYKYFYKIVSKVFFYDSSSVTQLIVSSLESWKLSILREKQQTEGQDDCKMLKCLRVVQNHVSK